MMGKSFLKLSAGFVLGLMTIGILLNFVCTSTVKENYNVLSARRSLCNVWWGCGNRALNIPKPNNADGGGIISKGESDDYDDFTGSAPPNVADDDSWTFDSPSPSKYKSKTHKRRDPEELEE